ncbi:GNAT family N-acetyltransferase [Planococcus sp. CAU13]|uniref:GNAT family N-acetyltransferase n=1 Tax=Planococcus sp. CAU13 TaxID=1541197 RepID=UPI00052FF49E|nr:GNAT family protein [Planococcus sp. CAU13]
MNKPIKFQTLKTERLVLREVTKDDADSLLAYLSDEEVTRHMGLAPFTTVEDTLDEVEWYNSIFDKGTGMRWGITLKDEDRVIGSCGFLNLTQKHHRAEIGFELSREHWGKGIAAEALQAVIYHGFSSLNLNRIEALIEPANSPSQKLVEKTGFLREGLLRDYEYTQGKFDDLYMYSMLKREFEIS